MCRREFLQVCPVLIEYVLILWIAGLIYHLTWVFLGDRKELETAIDQLQEISPLEEPIEVKELGYFGRPPKIFFAKSEEKILYDKAREFRRSGFDLYRFKPHMTL